MAPLHIGHVGLPPWQLHLEVSVCGVMMMRCVWCSMTVAALTSTLARLVLRELELLRPSRRICRAAQTMAAPVVSFASGLFVILTVASFVATIGATYYICAFTTLAGNPHCQNGITHLPVISFTWESAPSSFLSRWCVGMFCGCLAVCQFFIYWINEGPASLAMAPAPSSRRRAKSFCNNEFLLVMALTAIFCLSWVGAICDSTVPSCRGKPPPPLPIARRHRRRHRHRSQPPTLTPPRSRNVGG